ncbi:MAG: DUF308 domain-containing protein [Eubacteriaceae bacterium]|nr:DUF308 domain-containing protein [Eubacteriaceae bacterium]
MKSLKCLLQMSGTLTAILGIIVLFAPLSSLALLARFIDIAMLIDGISEIAAYIGEDKRQGSAMVLAGGIFSALIGCWALSATKNKAMGIIAVWLIATGATRVLGSFSRKSENSALWGWQMALGALGSALGFMLLISAHLSAALITSALAAMLISHGIGNIILFYLLDNLSRADRGNTYSSPFEEG